MAPTVTRAAPPRRSGRGARGRGPSPRRPLVPVLAVLVLVGAGVAAYALLHARANRAAERDVAERYAKRWAAGDYAGLYRDLSSISTDRVAEARFTSIMRGALTTATARRVIPGKVRRSGDGFVVPVRVATRLFGTLRGTIDLRLDGTGKSAGVRWTKSMALPGLRRGETLSRTTQMPARADILARDGTTLAGGADRSSQVPNIASQVVGSLGTALPADATKLRALGVPADARVGVSGLERILNPELVGTPGGTLRAGDRVLAKVAPKKAKAVRSSISPEVVKAAAAAQEGAPSTTGTTVIDSRTGEVLGFQGAAWSAQQPPGSTMKIVTASAALEDGVAKTTSTYPRETEAKGFGIQNSDEELCGGTLVESFAHSCNSVFVPLGVKLGAKRLVDMAEAYGFNRPVPGVPGADESTIPQPSDLAQVNQVAASSIGQDRVQATSLQVALMAATVANGGRQPRLTFLQTDRSASTRRVTSPGTAAAMKKLMIAVIADGTGTKARVGLPGIVTAGKTGTAELASTQGAQCDAEQAARDAAQQPDSVTDAPEPVSPCGNADGKSTTAWMSAFAPASRRGSTDPIAVGVLRAQNFQGGATAAPVAQKVLTAALSR